MMSFIHSLFCRHGADNRQRYFLINLAAAFAFALTALVFKQYPAIQILFLAVLASVLTFSGLRRLRDASKNNYWLLSSVLLFVLVGLLIIVSDSLSSVWLLIAPLLSSTILLTYPSTHTASSAAANYILGYSGPVDLTNFQKPGVQSRRRVEPVIEGEQLNNPAHSINHESTVVETGLVSPRQDNDLGTKCRTLLDSGLRQLENKLSISRPLLLGALLATVAILLTIIGLSTSSWLSHNDSQSSDSTSPNQSASIDNDQDQQIDQLLSFGQMDFQHQVTLPDNFDLASNQYQGLALLWQGDNSDQQQLWHIATASGDKSCQEIAFNNKKRFRTVSVSVDQYGDYTALFSPIDRSTLVKALAKAGSFELCGYRFSLKGSQATLGKHNYYQQFLN
ncbi:hypothetical protein J7384_16370 [Endozoicomonas sp. G2_1]|uniref:hypothetical protein n=1 Tax=Endozoicomonas sp. G2_1 TaxID=2821091 RepID=UPI001AD9D7A4|nr:hypothetical protein [Endozoicomonas sp. G2_1]MBO9491937.1 hypothetical protein [Endozoicomonas sp. G2_1]